MESPQRHAICSHQRPSAFMSGPQGPSDRHRCWFVGLADSFHPTVCVGLRNGRVTARNASVGARNRMGRARNRPVVARNDPSPSAMPW